MNLTSRETAPVVVLHGGPSIPCNYLYPLEGVIPSQHRSLVFYDQLGCGLSDEPPDVSYYSMSYAVRDLHTLLQKLGIRRFHLYGNSYGGMLAFEYLKDLVTNNRTGYTDDEDDNDDTVQCLSVVLSSAPTNVRQVEADMDRLMRDVVYSSSSSASPDAVRELFRRTHQCRLPEMPLLLRYSYARAGTIWSGMAAVSDYVARPPDGDHHDMPPALVLRGEHDFVTEASVWPWKEVFNHTGNNQVRFETLKGCSHHMLFEQGTAYGKILDDFFCEFD